MIPISKPLLGEEEGRAILQVLRSGMIVQGEKVAELEGHFANLCGTRYAVAVSSGTAALHIALLAHGIGPGDEVITTPFTFIASTNAILYVGASPIFVDIEPVMFNINPELIEQAITARTKAILPVHIYGCPCNIDPIVDVAIAYGLEIIWDAAQAVGARYKNTSVAKFGTSCFSLYATKNITAGEGGIITTDDEEVANKCRTLRNHGMGEQRYQYNMLGYNYRMSDIHAAIALAQLVKLDEFNTLRKGNATYFTSALFGISTPYVPEGYNHVWHQYTIRAKNRDRLVDTLRAFDIGATVYYPNLCYDHPHVRDRLDGIRLLPVAEQATREVLSLPVHPALSQKDLQYIVDMVNRLC